MALKDYLAISGQPGLYKHISQGRNGVIVESLAEGKRSHVPATAKVSALSDISIFTQNGEIPLRQVFEQMQAHLEGRAALPHKSPDAELKEFFAAVVPDYDPERVYVSDIKKVVMWYNQLQGLGMTDFAEPKAEAPAADAEAPGGPTRAEKPPKAKANPGKAGPRAPTAGKTAIKTPAKSQATRKAQPIKRAE